MRKWFFVFMIIVLFLIPVSAQAQTGITFSSVKVQIWPEYDQPSVLVIYNYALAEDIPLPTSLELRIPVQASINAVAFVDDVGNLLTADYERKVSGDWAIISMITSSRIVQVEYYDAYLLNGQTRQYEYTWPGNYSVDVFQVIFQQPINVTNLILNPIVGTGAIGPDGLTYYSGTVEGLELDQTYSLAIEYQKSDSTLSASQLSVQPSAPLDENVDGLNNWTDNLPLILGIAGGALVVGGLIFGFNYRNRGVQRPIGSQRKRHSSKENSVGDVYCPQCGKRSQPGDVFCRTCGSRLRRPG